MWPGLQGTRRGTEGLLASVGQRFPDEWQLRRAGGSPWERLSLKPDAPQLQPEARVQPPLMHITLSPETPGSPVLHRELSGAALRLVHSLPRSSEVPWWPFLVLQPLSSRSKNHHKRSLSGQDNCPQAKLTALDFLPTGRQAPALSVPRPRAARAAVAVMVPPVKLQVPSLFSAQRGLVASTKWAEESPR